LSLDIVCQARSQGRGVGDKFLILLKILRGKIQKKFWSKFLQTKNLKIQATPLLYVYGNIYSAYINSNILDEPYEEELKPVYISLVK